MKKILFLLIIVTLNLKAQCWEESDIGLSESAGYKVQFINDSIGYVDDNNSTFLNGVPVPFLLKTKDGGKVWTQFKDADRSIFESFYFVNENLGFIYGKSTIARTDDGGKIWTAPIQNNNYTFRDISFIDKNIGYALSYPRHVWKSSDGGKNWQILFEFAPGNNVLPGNKILFLNDKTGFILNGKLLKTINGGLSWADLGYFGVFDFELKNNKLIILSKEKKLTFDTNGYLTNSESLFFHPSGTRGIGEEFSFLSAMIGYYVSSNGIYYTKDGGINWSRIYNDRANDVFISSKGGVIVGLDYKKVFYYSCLTNLENSDFYDRCYFSQFVDSKLSKTYNISTNNSRAHDFNDLINITTPYCWTPSSRIVKPYWMSFSGDGSLIKINVKKSSLSGESYLKAALFSGSCNQLNILECGQIDQFSNEIFFQQTIEVGKKYYLVFDGSDINNSINFNVEFNGGAITSTQINYLEQILLSPNPTNSDLHVSHGFSDILAFDMYSIEGILVKTGKIINNRIDVRNLMPGTYFIKIINQNDRKQVVKKFVICS